MVTKKKDQHKAGIPSKPRGQEMGRAGETDKGREAKRETPALRGRRRQANAMFADDSTQHVGTNPAQPRSNSPSVAAQTGGGHVGETGGEKDLKRRQAKRRPSK